MSDAKNLLDALVAGMEHASEQIDEIERIDEMDRADAEAKEKEEAPAVYHYVAVAPGWFIVSKNGERAPIVAWRIADYGDFFSNPEAVAVNHQDYAGEDNPEKLLVSPDGKCYGSHELTVYASEKEWLSHGS